MDALIFSRPVKVIVVLAALLLAGNAYSAGVALRVTNDGADSATCGSSAKPCRSISQAIENASDGDTIEVGAGRYGDISGTGTFTGPGDEHPAVYRREACIVCITKAVRIYSLHGAAVTTIEGSSATQYTSTVLILHDGVTFGVKGRGFTLTGGNQNGLKLDVDTVFEAAGQLDLLRRNVTVAGNVDIADQFGFVFSGPAPMRDCPTFDSCTTPADIRFTDNTAVSNANGFAITVNAYVGSGHIVLQNNVALGAGIGFNVQTGHQGFGSNDTFSAAFVQLLSDVASHCTLGFSTLLAGIINGNTASDNSLAGFLVVPAGLTSFKGNSAIGNAGPGVILQFSPDINTDQSSSSFQPLRANNFYGNDRNRPALSIGTGAEVVGTHDSNGFGFNPGPSAHCGVLNVGALTAIIVQGNEHAAPVITVSAPGSYWGSTAGPNPTGAGDAVGGPCDQNNAITIGKPFSTVSLGITSSP